MAKSVSFLGSLTIIFAAALTAACGGEESGSRAYTAPSGDGGAGAAGTATAGAATGGSGGEVAAAGTGGSGTAGTSACPPPPAQVPVGAAISDFEGNMELKVGAPAGAWSVFSDQSAGSTQTPASSAMLSATLLEAPRDTSTMAVHSSGSGFTSWGAGLGVSFLGSGIVLDASAYQGVRFWAKGSGTIRFAITTPGTSTGFCICDTAAGGCGDHFGAYITLTDTFTEYTYTWDKLAQEGWAFRTAFDDKALVGLNFVASGAKPIAYDLWLDDVSFIE